MKNLIEALEKLADNPNLFAELTEDERIALVRAAGKLSRPTREEMKLRRRAKDLATRKSIAKKDRALRAETGIRKARTTSVFVAPKQIAMDAQQLNSGEESAECSSPRKCYVCNAEFTRLHFFYDAMCTPCGDLNYKKRFQTSSLVGRTALITGSRLKIGYHATLMMLRAGARVIATTRFPVDAASRFSKEEDFNIWKDRLEIFGLDLRHTPSVEIFAHYLIQHIDRLDIIIHNAAQTVRRPPAFYAHLMKDELTPPSSLSEAHRQLLNSFEKCKATIAGFSLRDTNKTSQISSAAAAVLNSNQAPSLIENSFGIESIVGGGSLGAVGSTGVGICASAQLSQVPYSIEGASDVDKIFPKDKLDVDLQQVDLRETNSWRYKIGDVPTPELLEVQLVNAIAPFVLTSKLLPLMKKDYTGEKHIVNVTAMEGKFHRFTKSERHPHTNMAKAALNMLTHTAARDLAKDGIFMNAVDTGWVTDENPAEMLKKVQSVHDFQPPLDIVDGAARLCDPFFYGMTTGHHWCGKFLKDYQPIDW